MSNWMESYNTKTFDEIVSKGDWKTVNKYFLEQVKYFQCEIDDLKYMIDMGANPRADNDKAIVNAACNGYVKTLFFLKEYGLDVNAHDGRALVNAIRYHDVRTMKLLLENGAKINDNVWKAIGMYHGDDTLKVLLDFGFDSNEALIYVLKYENDEILLNKLKHLFDAGCDINTMLKNFFSK